jgi:hypothetical protein
MTTGCGPTSGTAHTHTSPRIGVESTTLATTGLHYHCAALPLGRIRGGQVFLGRPDNTVRHGCWNITVEMPDLLSGGEFAGLADEQADAFAERFGRRGEPQLLHDALQCGHLIGLEADLRNL